MHSVRNTVPLEVADLSAFAKSLRTQLTSLADKGVPSHLTLLNCISRSAGFRNYQALRAEAAAKSGAACAGAPLEVPADAGLSRSAERALRQFDRQGRLIRWPTQFAVQRIALWALWTRLPQSRDLSEREVNEYIGKYHAFNDVATLRRELVNMKMLWRTPDGRVYRRLAAAMPDEARLFLATLMTLTRR